MKIPLNILIIDDSEDDRELYARLLRSDEKAEWSIYEAETGEEGLETYLGKRIHSVLLDYSLPGRDGLEVLSDLASHNGHAAVVMLTGQGNELVAIDSMKKGAQDYLVKGDVTPEKLQKAIHNAMDRVTMIRKIDEQREALESFSMVLAHDLRTPIHQIRGFCDLIGTALEKGKYDKVREYREYVDRAALSMSQLIDTLVKYNGVGRGDIPFEPVSLHGVVDEALSNLSHIIGQRNAKVTYDALPEVTGNAPQLAQLLQNIISNGIKYCRAEIPTVHIAAKEGPYGYEISVKDNGIGIPEDCYSRVFEPFKRLHGPGEFSGTGLGLATCKKIVDRHQGKIWCESQEGQGTTFTFTLPG